MRSIAKKEKGKNRRNSLLFALRVNPFPTLEVITTRYIARSAGSGKNSTSFALVARLTDFKGGFFARPFKATLSPLATNYRDKEEPENFEQNEFTGIDFLLAVIGHLDETRSKERVDHLATKRRNSP